MATYCTPEASILKYVFFWMKATFRLTKVFDEHKECVYVYYMRMPKAISEFLEKKHVQEFNLMIFALMLNLLESVYISKMFLFRHWWRCMRAYVVEDKLTITIQRSHNVPNSYMLITYIHIMFE